MDSRNILSWLLKFSGGDGKPRKTRQNTKEFSLSPLPNEENPGKVAETLKKPRNFLGRKRPTKSKTPRNGRSGPSCWWPQPGGSQHGVYKQVRGRDVNWPLLWADEVTDLFSLRFQEGISFPNFGERSILELPLSSSALCPLLYRTEHFSRGGKGAKRYREKGGKGVASKEGKKEKRTRENRSG